MEIKYLTKLNSNRVLKDRRSDDVKTLQPISLSEISNLENIYNNGNPFPVVLKELLFIAGAYCYLLDYGFNDIQQEMQDEARADLTKYKRNLNIPRPFYVIDIYNSGSQFLFVYLDEPVDDPVVYEAVLDINNPSWINSLNTSLSGLINLGLKKALSGYNPF